MQEPAYWECPACNNRKYTTEDDGRKKCYFCKRVWGRPIRKIPKKKIVAKMNIGEETEKEFKTIKALVYFLMQSEDRCRNDDKWLTYKVFQEVAKQHGEKIFIPFNIFKDFPAFETVKRVRAYIQNNQNELPPTDPEVIKKRSQRQHKVRQMMAGEFKV